jgi:hypothetical protein
VSNTLNGSGLLGTGAIGNYLQPLAPVLAEELLLFRVKMTLSVNETFEAWRERDHDALVLALALALYVGSFPPVAFAFV